MKMIDRRVEANGMMNCENGMNQSNTHLKTMDMCVGRKGTILLKYILYIIQVKIQWISAPQ